MSQERTIARLAEAMLCFIEAHGKTGCSMADMRGCYDNHGVLNQNQAIRDLIESGEIVVKTMHGEAWIISTEFCR